MVKVGSVSGEEDRRTSSRYYLRWPGGESPANNVQAFRFANQFINSSLLQTPYHGLRIINYEGVIKWAKELIRFPGIHNRLLREIIPWLGDERDNYSFFTEAMRGIRDMGGLIGDWINLFRGLESCHEEVALKTVTWVGYGHWRRGRLNPKNLA